MSTEIKPTVEQVLIPLFTGMWAMQAVAAASRLGIADQLASGPKTADEVAATSGTHPRATTSI